MVRDERVGVAYHEAGHATAIRALGGVVTGITIDPVGRTEFTLPTTTSRRDQVAAYLAGLDAEASRMGMPQTIELRNRYLLGRIATGNLTDMGADDLQVIGLLEQLEPDQAERELRAADRAAWRLLKANWSEVERIAQGLLAGAGPPAPRDASYEIAKARWHVAFIVMAVAAVVLLAHLGGGS